MERGFTGVAVINDAFLDEVSDRYEANQQAITNRFEYAPYEVLREFNTEYWPRLDRGKSRHGGNLGPLDSGGQSHFPETS
jgi:hypothetical protein